LLSATTDVAVVRSEDGNHVTDTTDGEASVYAPVKPFINAPTPTNLKQNVFLQ